MSAMGSQITSLDRLFKAQIKENIAPRHWPLWGEFTGEFTPSPKYTLFSKGTHICLMKSLIIMFPVCPIWFQDPILEMLSNPDKGPV